MIFSTELKLVLAVLIFLTEFVFTVLIVLTDFVPTGLIFLLNSVLRYWLFLLKVCDRVVSELIVKHPVPLPEDGSEGSPATAAAVAGKFILLKLKLKFWWCCGGGVGFFAEVFVSICCGC